jgi:prevent-host-death family protein
MERAVGIRRLRDGLTRYLGRVRRGERLVVTDRGRPVAVLAPYRQARAGADGRLDAVLASGHVSPAQRPFTGQPEPVRGRGRRASLLIAESRR